MSRKRFIISLENESTSAIDEMEISPEIQAISEDDIQGYESEVTDGLQAAQAEASANIEDGERLNDVVDALEDLVNIVDGIEKIEPTDMALIQTTANMAVAGTDTPASALLPSMESFKDKAVALEQLKGKITLAQEGLLESLANAFKNFVDVNQFYYSWINTQSMRLKKIRQKLAKTKSTTKAKSVSVTVRLNKYFKAGKDALPVETTKELVSKIKEVNTFNASVIPAVKKFTTSEPWKGFKTLGSMVGIGGDKPFNDMFSALDTFTSELIKVKGFQANGNQYSTPVFLGMSHMVVNKPEKGTYTEDDISSKAQVLSNMHVAFIRDEKFGIPTEKKTFENVTLQDLEAILNSCEETLKELNGFNSYLMREIVVVSTHKQDQGSLGEKALGYISKTYRIYMKSYQVVYETTAATYNFSNGVVKNALSFVDTALNSSQWSIEA